MEKFRQLAEPEAAEYAIQAMQAGDAECTQKSSAEDNRVQDRLADVLVTAGEGANAGGSGRVAWRNKRDETGGSSAGPSRAGH